MGTPRLTLTDLQRMCDERESESLTLEFKPCNELRVGSDLRENGEKRTRTPDDVLDELTRDVTAMLNAAGGTLIYGIHQDSRSRAEKLDASNAYSRSSRHDNVTPEKVTDWLRAHVQPRPTVNVYPVEAGTSNPDGWYLVLDVPQGEVAYMARDHRFHKRVSSTAQMMEQYEVADVMNRMRGAALEARFSLTPSSTRDADGRLQYLLLKAHVTSSNYVASEHGVMRLTVAWPLKVDRRYLQVNAQRIHPEEAELRIARQDDAADAESVRLLWGAHTGAVVLPGDWRPMPTLQLIAPAGLFPGRPVYVFEAILHTPYAPTRRTLHAVQQVDEGGRYEVRPLDVERDVDVIADFWRTYHAYKQALAR